MPAYDLLVLGGTLVDDRSARPGDIAVADGRIAAVTAPGELDPDDAGEVIQAAGKLVLPGGVDAHVHLDFAIGPWVSQQYDAAAAPPSTAGPPRSWTSPFAIRARARCSRRLAAKRADAEAGICCDFGLHLIVMGDVGDAELAEIAGVIDAGVPTVKVFMNFPEFYPGDGGTAELFEAVGREGGTAIVHAENADVITRRTQRLIDAGKKDWRFNDDSRPDWVEAEAVERAIRLAEAGDCPLFVFHVTSAAAASAIRGAQGRGLPVFSETCHNYVVFSKEDVVERPNGADWGNMPPLRPPWNRDEIWRALDERVIEHVSTDDYTGPLSNRNGAGLDLPAPPAGHNGMETRLAVLYTEAVVKRGWPLERFVEIAGTGIARKLGLWPRKGSLLPGRRRRPGRVRPRAPRHLQPRRAAHGRLQHLGRVRVRGAARDDDPARRADGARRGVRRPGGHGPIRASSTPDSLKQR